MRKEMLFLKVLFLTLTTIALASCEVSGIFSVEYDDPITLKGIDGESYTYEIGDYESIAAWDNLEMTTLSLGIKEKGGDEFRQFDFHIPEDIELPERGGEVFIPATVNGQNYDLEIRLTLREFKGEIQEERVPCQISSDDNKHRHMRYYLRTEEATYTLNLRDPLVMATFRGEEVLDSEKVYLEQGPCL